MRVAIATVQVPFLSGGAEALAEGLRQAIAERGHPVDIVTLPFRFFPPTEVERAMSAWEAEDFGAMNLYEPDRVVCLKFPAYGLRHPRKVLWLCHQHRAAYEPLDPAKASPAERALVERVAAYDARHIPESNPRFTISARVTERLKQSSGISSRPLYHPPPFAAHYSCSQPEPYVFFPSRIEHAKRQDLVLRAMRHVRARGSLVFAGEGGQSGPLRELAEALGIAARVRILGQVTRDELLGLYAHAAGVCFTPLDEDYGYVTLEAMLASKPVITCRDSGGPVEFVVDGETGWIVDPAPEDVAAAIDQVFSDSGRAARRGRAGRARYRELVPGWPEVVEALLA